MVHFSFSFLAHNSLRHAWLHYTIDTPLKKSKDLPYLIDPQPNQTGTDQAYTPHNWMLNPDYDPELMKNTPGFAESPKIIPHEPGRRTKHTNVNIDNL